MFLGKRMLLSEQNFQLNKIFGSLASLAIIVSGNVLELKSARSQSVIAHIMSCSLEPKNSFLGGKLQIESERLAKRADRRYSSQAKKQTGGREACSGVLIVDFSAKWSWLSASQRRLRTVFRFSEPRLFVGTTTPRS